MSEEFHSTVEAAPALSVVLPCYNEAEALPGLLTRIIAQLERTQLPFEIVAVNDGSRDGTDEVLEQLAQSDARLRALHLSRNFGHMAALTAGLDHAAATGAVITMDSDGQHPPELIPQMVQMWQNGADIVQTIRAETEDAGAVKKVTSTLFYSIINRLSQTPIIPGAADFRLMSRQAADALIQLPEKSRFVRGLVFWVGYKMEFLEFSAPARITGESKYSLLKMLSFALLGITSFSTILLRLSTLVGLCVVGLTLLYLIYIAFMLIFFPAHIVTGWTSLIVMVLLLGGLNLMAIGIVGEYIARIYDEVKSRPVYLLRK